MTHQLVNKLPGNLGLACGFWEDRRKGLFILFFENCPWKIQKDFVNTWECHTQNSSSSISTLSVDATLHFEHESRVPKELWMKILANLISWCFTFAVLIHAQQKMSVHTRGRFQVRSIFPESWLPNIQQVKYRGAFWGLEILLPRMKYTHEIVGIHGGALLPERAPKACSGSKTFRVYRPLESFNYTLQACNVFYSLCCITIINCRVPWT